MNNSGFETNSDNTHSGTVTGEKHLRLIRNNIQEKLFIAKLNDYKSKQKKLLKKSKNLIKTYEKCIKMAKQTDSPNQMHIDDIEHVVI